MAKADPRQAGTDELRVFAQLLEGRKTAVAGAVVMSMLSAVATLMLPLQVRDLVIALGQDERPIRPMLAMAGLALGAGLASAIGSFLLARAGEALVSEARFRIAAHILTLPFGAYDAKAPATWSPAPAPTARSCAPWWTSAWRRSRRPSSWPSAR